MTKVKQFGAWIQKRRVGCMLNIDQKWWCMKFKIAKICSIGYENVKGLCFYDLFDTSYVTDMWNWQKVNNFCWKYFS